jgi:DNA-binding NarL/FixJ family response regulator
MATNVENRRDRGILVVEDQELMRSTLREFLQQAFPDQHVAVAADGQIAIELARALRPRVAVMDVNLPDANGIDLTVQLRSTLPGIEVIVVSHLSGSAYVERARAAGALGYVTKDRIRVDLLPLVATVLGGAWSRGPR